MKFCENQFYTIFRHGVEMTSLSHPHLLSFT